MRCRSLILIAPSKLEWVEEILPLPKPDEIVIRTRTGAISVGTETPLYRGTHRSRTPTIYPRMTGYENIGEVIACGEQVQKLKKGDRVVASYGHRTHAIIPWQRAIRVPQYIPDSLALLSILGCDTIKGINKIKPHPDQKILITGAGTIGLLTLFNLKAHGIKQVDVVEPIRYRREFALNLGASRSIAPNESTLLGEEYDVGFECSSRQPAFELLQDFMRANSEICILADGNIEPLVLTPTFHEKELKVTASSDGEDYAQYANWFFEQVRHPPSRLEKLYEIETTIHNLQAVCEQLIRGEITPIKVLIHYDSNEQ